MKKTLKITGITLAVITVLLILLCIFTGFVPYILAKNILAPKCEIAYSEWPHYDAGILEGKTVSYDGLYAVIPEGMEKHTGKDGEVKENVFSKTDADGNTAMVYISGRSTTDMPSVSETLHENLNSKDLSDRDRKKAEKAIAKYEKAVEKYCARLGKTPPQDRYSFMDLMYSTNADNISFMSKDEATVQTFILTFKSMIAESTYGEAYRFETETGKGFISPYGEDRSKLMLELYDNNDLDTSYIVMISGCDEDTMYKIINSLRIESDQ